MIGRLNTNFLHVTHDVPLSRFYSLSSSIYAYVTFQHLAPERNFWQPFVYHIYFIHNNLFSYLNVIHKTCLDYILFKFEDTKQNNM